MESPPNRDPHAPLQILLVEDNPADIELTREGFKQAPVVNHLQVVSTAEEALEVLRGEAHFEGAEQPDLILLDLNLPGMSGAELLATVKNDARTADIPVLVLTTSSNPRDVDQVYRNHANAFLVKPVDFADFLALVRQVCEFWTNRANLPQMSERRPSDAESTGE